MEELNKMQCEYRTNSNKFFDHADRLHAEDQQAHLALAGRIGELEKLKSKYTMYAMVVLAFFAGAGWLNSVSFPHILKFFGL